MRALVLSAAVIVAPAAGGCASVQALPPTGVTGSVLLVDVDIRPDEAGQASTLALRYCTPPAPAGLDPFPLPHRLVTEHPEAARFIISAHDDTGAPMPHDGSGVQTRGAQGCVRVVLDIADLVDRLGDPDIATRAGDDVILSPDAWLLRAGEEERPTEGPELLVRVEPGPLAALLPWAALDEDDVQGTGRLAVDASSYRLKSETVFGVFPVEELDVAGARFRIARLDDGRAPEPLTDWIASAARAVALVHGRFPIDRVNVLVIPTHVERPVVVGFFSRGGGATVTFVVGDSSMEVSTDDLELTGRWTITHELAHALLPPVLATDAWFNEGLTTWHQDLLARRAGLILDDARYWLSLVRGLETGRLRAEEDGVSLETASTRMRELGSYQHAYWGGAALMLLADVEARRQGSSLEQLAVHLRNAHDDDRALPARTLLESVGSGPARIAASALLAAWDTHRTRSFPDVEPVLAALGVEVWPDGTVQLDDDAPLAHIRRAITRTVGEHS